MSTHALIGANGQENTEAQIEWENASTISGTSTVEDDVVGKLFSRVRHNRGKVGADSYLMQSFCRLHWADVLALQEAEKLLDSGCTTVDCRDASGCTPLMVACQVRDFFSRRNMTQALTFAAEWT